MFGRVVKWITFGVCALAATAMLVVAVWTAMRWDTSAAEADLVARFAAMKAERGDRATHMPGRDGNFAALVEVAASEAARTGEPMTPVKTRALATQLLSATHAVHGPDTWLMPETEARVWLAIREIPALLKQLEDDGQTALAARGCVDTLALARDMGRLGGLVQMSKGSYAVKNVANQCARVFSKLPAAERVTLAKELDVIAQGWASWDWLVRAEIATSHAFLVFAPLVSDAFVAGLEPAFAAHHAAAVADLDEESRSNARTFRVMWDGAAALQERWMLGAVKDAPAPKPFWPEEHFIAVLTPNVYPMHTAFERTRAMARVFQMALDVNSPVFKDPVTNAPFERTVTDGAVVVRAVTPPGVDPIEVGLAAPPAAAPVVPAAP